MLRGDIRTAEEVIAEMMAVTVEGVASLARSTADQRWD